MRINKLLSTAAVLAAFAMGSSAAMAQDCPHGDLDPRFCDRDGDLIADTPTDPAEQLDPDTLIFAYIPVEHPAVYKEAWSDLLTYLEEKTGKKVIFFPVQSNAAQIGPKKHRQPHANRDCTF